MSIGNLKDSGNQGNNFPWQLKMLMGQQCACDQLTAIAGNTDDVEFLLTAILTTLQAGTEFEAKFVLETCPGAPPTTRVLLEVRIWNTDTGTWEPPQYYLPGSNTPVPIDPGCTLEYTDPTGVLAMIYNELQTQTGILTDIETDTTSIDVTLTNLFAAYSAGQQACASSLSVTLCTEQGTDLANIDTSTSNALIELLAQGVTLDSIETLITTLNATVSTEVTLGQVLAELQAINIDTDGLNQEATQLLVLAALNTVITNTTGLATEVTLNALLTAFNAEDFATETTLALIQAITSQMTFTGGDLNVSANMQVGGTDVAAGNPVPVVLPIGVNTSYYNRALGSGVIVPSGAKSVSVQNIGNDDITMTTDSSPATVVDPGIALTYTAEPGKTLGAYTFLHSSVNSLYIVTQVR